MPPWKPSLKAKRIPYVDRAWIPEDKLKLYALNPDHPKGRHKARRFKSVLGIERDEWRYLHDQILDRLSACPVHAARVAAPHGVEYEVRIPIDGRNGRSALVATAWMLDAERRPRLTSAYVE